MRTVLLRHATANTSYSGPDRSRPLSRSGRLEAKRIAKQIAALGDMHGVISSPAVRAVETAEAVRAELGLAKIEIESRLYLGDSETYLQFLQSHQGYVITGHEPCISMAGMELAARDFSIMPAHALVVEDGTVVAELAP